MCESEVVDAKNGIVGGAGTSSDCFCLHVVNMEPRITSRDGNVK